MPVVDGFALVPSYAAANNVPVCRGCRWSRSPPMPCATTASAVWRQAWTIIWPNLTVRRNAGRAGALVAARAAQIERVERAERRGRGVGRPADRSGRFRPAPRLGADGASALIRQLIEAYLRGARKHWEACEKAVAGGDLELLAQSCHALKSSSFNVGALRFAGLCREIESLSQEAARDEVQALYPGLQAEWHAVSDALGVMLAGDVS